jgi:hypothetical protein
MPTEPYSDDDYRRDFLSSDEEVNAVLRSISSRSHTTGPTTF